MERLTYRPTNPYISKTSGELVKAYSDYSVREIINRLADYEDMGLTPELVQETAKLAIWIHENGLDKIKEWIRADKEGRLIVLDNTPRQVSPCDTCESGWGKATTTGYDSCFNHCERLAQYRKQGGNNG